MRLVSERLRTSPTDLANFLACRHKTTLDLLVAKGELAKPTWIDPLAETLRQRGDEHERRYVDRLRAEGLDVVDLRDVPPDERAARTTAAMREGADVIVQAALEDDQWTGYADVLRKVPVSSPALGSWSYEAHDTKLARETRSGTILQLCAYSELLAGIQRRLPDEFHVVTPLSDQSCRLDEFIAFHRQVKAQFLEFTAAGQAGAIPTTYPEPVEHCGVCRWSGRCKAQRRRDDHLSLVAGMGTQQRAELASRGITTLAALAAMPLPLEFRPSRGAKETYERLREQARLQAEERATGVPTYELLSIDPDFGLTQLPEPTPGDLFLDLEGDPFGRAVVGAASGDSTREYLFGLGRVAEDGTFAYTCRWAFTDAEERAAFDAVVSDIIAALEADPAIHIYHYAPYEPSAFKRLMGRYAAREADLDRLLRGRRFVDLFAVARHALRAGVEHYSIKNLEPLYGFEREVELDDAGNRRRIVELALETHDPAAVTPDVRAAVEGYNRDDCRSLVGLRRWLEARRGELIAQGRDVSRPAVDPGTPTENVSERQRRVRELRARLLEGVPAEFADRTREQQARYLLAYLLDWHDREDKVVWWEYFRLCGLSDEELLDEADAVAGLEFVERREIVRHKKTGRPTGSVVDRYRYPPQECELQPGNGLKLRDGRDFGKVVATDRLERALDVRKSGGVADVHPASAFAHEHYRVDQLTGALFRLGQTVADHALRVDALPGAAADLLLGRTGRGLVPAPAGEPVVAYATNIASGLGDTALPIQGPPGAGKTYTGAKMIAALVAQGKRVGVTANSHKVIRHLLDEALRAADASGLRIRAGHKLNDTTGAAPGRVACFDDNAPALQAVLDGSLDVLGGTAFFWAREECRATVDVLFIDEAGQMSLANALAMSHAAPALVLLGDPQQLEQPQKASHPDGVGVSALDHILAGAKTMPPDRGLFLPVTWRLSPAICAFTSEVFYERRLTSKPGLEQQRIAGSPGQLEGAGLVFVPVEHNGCRSASDEEAELVAGLLSELLDGSMWIDETGTAHRIGLADVLVVAPYNAHVSRLQVRLAGVAEARGRSPADLRIGTVDKFQGQQAAVAFYSMATSRPEDAPRGLRFLYSLNRLNVATSRARCLCVLVANPRLFEPDCRTPGEMRLANALCRYREMSQRHTRPAFQVAPK